MSFFVALLFLWNLALVRSHPVAVSTQLVASPTFPVHSSTTFVSFSNRFFAFATSLFCISSIRTRRSLSHFFTFVLTYSSRFCLSPLLSDPFLASRVCSHRNQQAKSASKVSDTSSFDKSHDILPPWQCINVLPQITLNVSDISL